MSNKLFTDALSDETLVKLTDDMLKHENINKNNSKIKFNHALFKIIPAVAAIVLVIGLINILTIFMDGDIGSGNLGASVEVESDSVDLKLGTYVSGELPGIEYSSIFLSDDNKFSFILNLASSYIPMGTYSIENGQLILHCNNNEEYIFEIKNGQLIYYEGGNGGNWIQRGMIYILQEEDNVEEVTSSEQVVEYIDFNISIQPEQYNENPFSNTPYDGAVVNKIIRSVDEFESMLNDEYFGITETDGTGRESAYIRSLSDIYNDEYFKDRALVAVTFEYASIPIYIYGVKVGDGYSMTVWAREFEDMSLPENEKFTSGLYTTRVFLIEVKKSDVQSVTSVTPGLDYAPTIIEEDKQEYYTYEEYIEFIENERALLRSLIDCTDENWMPVSGEPVLTQEIYDKIMVNADINFKKELEDIKNGVKIPKLPQHSNPYAVYETLEPRLDLKCRIESGKWVLYNDSEITETFDTKDEMLERARWWLARAIPAGEIDMAQANTVYRRLYFAVNGETDNLSLSANDLIEVDFGYNLYSDYIDFNDGGFDGSQYITYAELTCINFKFDGIHQPFNISDLTNLKLIINGKETKFSLNDTAYMQDIEHTGGNSVYKIFLKDGNGIERNHVKGIILDIPSTIQLTGNYMGNPFVSLEGTVSDELIDELMRFSKTANPDDLRRVIWGDSVKNKKNTPDIIGDISGLTGGVVVFVFDGVQQWFYKSDLTDFKLTLNGEEIPFSLENAIYRYLAEDNIYRYLINEEDGIVTWYCLRIEESFDRPGIYQLTGKYMGKPFVSGEMIVE